MTNTFSTNNELYQARMRKSVDLIVIDDVAVLHHFEPDDGTLCRTPGKLTEQLVAFYKQEKPADLDGQEHHNAKDPSEEYSIAVGDETTLETLNEILVENEQKIRQIQTR